jgi:hypothetical protein
MLPKKLSLKKVAFRLLALPHVALKAGVLLALWRGWIWVLVNPALADMGAEFGFSKLTCQHYRYEWSAQGGVSQLTPTLERCVGEGHHVGWVAIRHFHKGALGFFLVLDPERFQVDVLPEACLKCEPVTREDLMGTRWARAVEEMGVPGYTGGRRTPDKVPGEQGFDRWAGVAHSQRGGKEQGFFLTIDLCPSRQSDFEETIWKALAQKRPQVMRPVPVGIALSGSWWVHHEAAFEGLLQAQARGDIEIAWVNHTLSHPYQQERPVSENFLLRPGVSVENEIFGLEKRLLEANQVPSPFFRFPGLIANELLVQQLKKVHLIPIGADAWLAKGQRPQAGSVILIHGNGNEPQGIRAFERWLAQPGERTFLSLEHLFP